MPSGGMFPGPGSGSVSVSQLAAENMAALLNKIHRNLEDCQILVLGDSTGNDQNEWVYLMAQRLGPMFPAYTIKHTLWDPVGFAWPVPDVLSVGTGAQSITVYSGSVAGARTTYAQGGLWGSMIQGLAPDVVMINYGHNQGATPGAWFSDYINLTEALLEVFPGAGIVQIIQNPETLNTLQGQRATVYEAIARMRGFGTVNIHQVFFDYGNWNPDLMADNVHPNSAGQLLWVAEVMKLYTYDRLCPIRGNNSSSFMQRGIQLLVNGDFALFGGALPDGWVVLAGAPTAAKDLVNFESPNGYSVLLSATGGAQAAIGQGIPASYTKGRWITALVRMRIEVGATDNTGVVGLYDNVTGLLKDNDGGRGARGGAFRWVVVSKFIPVNAATVRIYIYPDTGVTNAQCRVDSASVVLGRLPMN